MKSEADIRYRLVQCRECKAILDEKNGPYLTRAIYEAIIDELELILK